MPFAIAYHSSCILLEETSSKNYYPVARLFGIACLIGLFWQANTPYEGVIKSGVGLWMTFFAIASVLIIKMKECNDADKKIAKLIIALYGGSIFLLCAIACLIFWMKS